MRRTIAGVGGGALRRAVELSSCGPASANGPYQGWFPGATGAAGGPAERALTVWPAPRGSRCWGAGGESPQNESPTRFVTKACGAPQHLREVRGPVTCALLTTGAFNLLLAVGSPHPPGPWHATPAHCIQIASAQSFEKRDEQEIKDLPKSWAKVVEAWKVCGRVERGVWVWAAGNPRDHQSHRCLTRPDEGTHRAVVPCCSCMHWRWSSYTVRAGLRPCGSGDVLAYLFHDIQGKQHAGASPKW